MKIEIYPRAEADIIHQFRHYLVDPNAPVVAFRFRAAVRESIAQRNAASAYRHAVQGSILAFVHGRQEASRRSASTTLKFPTVCA